MKSVSLKLDSRLAKEIGSAMRFGHYSTKTEFIREAIRDKILEVRAERAKEMAWEKLYDARGIFKDRALSDEEFYRKREEFSKALEKRLKKKHGIK